MKTLTFTILFNMILLGLQAQPDIGPTYVVDDFSTATEYDNGSGDSVLWNADGSVYALTRAGGGDLQIDATGADPAAGGFWVSFGQNPSVTNTIDLSADANIRYRLRNPTGDTIFVQLALFDINDVVIEILPDTMTGNWGEKQQSKVGIAPGATVDVTVNFTNGHGVANWNCSAPSNCPKINPGADLSQIKRIRLTINHGAGDVNQTTLSAFTGTVYLEYFEAGSDITPITEGAEENDFCNVYPVPATDELTVALDKGPGTGTLISLQGQVIKTVRLEEGNNKLNLSGLNTGGYLLKITTNSATAHKYIQVR